jgi:uncharacterized protein (DUF2252 family)
VATNGRWTIAGKGGGPVAAAPSSTPAATSHRSPAERFAFGRAVRDTVPLAAHAECRPEVAGRDPVALLERQAASRVPELVPIRYGRMLASPFAFYRGGAAIMARDLAGTSTSGLQVQLCGDAHLANFGLFGSPERQLVFDSNDFDETLPGPFEYDVKRLVASLSVAGRVNGYRRKHRAAIVAAAAARYRTAMARFAKMRDLEVWYAHLDAARLQQQLAPLLDPARRRRLAKHLDRTQGRDSVQLFGKLVDSSGDTLRIRARPPLIVPLREFVSVGDGADVERRFRDLISQYRRSLQPDRRRLLERYRFVDMARKVVGVGSVGTRCWVVLLTGRDDDDPLFLQIKEAQASVYDEYLGGSRYSNQGERVVAGQRLMQQASDIFLGWQRSTGIDGVQRDFYVRQLRDWKGSVTVEDLAPDGMRIYGELCAWSLARAHARSGDRLAIAGYLGSSPEFDAALVAFAEAYADLDERDHCALADAVATCRVAATSGL